MGQTVIVVEDDQDIQDYYEVILTDFPVKVIKSVNGKEALSVIESGVKIDLIILDIVMPVMDGEEFLKILREEKGLSIPVIVSSVDEVSASRLEAMLDVQGVFFKLGKIENLLDLVKTNLGL